MQYIETMDGLLNGEEMSSSWGEPIPFEKPLKERIDLDCLPKVFADMCKAISESLSVSTDMVASAGLGVLSVCCNQHWICLKDGWYQPLSLYTVGCADAGERKSPVLNALMKPIDGWVLQKNIELKPIVAESRQKRKNIETALRKAENDLKRGRCDEAETIRLAQEIEDFQTVRYKRLYSGDCTTEKLTELLNENNERFSIVASEGGILQVLSGERYGDGGNYDLYCQAYNGETVAYDRKGSGTIVLEKPVLSMVLFVQQVILEKLLGNRILQGVGLVDRCLFFKPQSTIGQERFETKPINPKIETAYSNMVRRLLNDSQSRTLRLSDDATKQYANWYNHFTQDIQFQYGDIMGWASKFRGTVGRIAGIMQLCEDGSDIVSEAVMYDAIVVADYFAEQARYILRDSGLTETEALAKYILERIRNLKGKTNISDDGRIILPYSDLARSVHKKDLQQKRDYAKPIQALIDRNYIDVDDEDLVRFRNLYINPGVWNE